MGISSAMSFLKSTLPKGFPKMVIIPITEAELLSTVSSLNSKNSSGYHSLSNKIIMLCSQHISNPLTYIFNQSLSQGTFLEQLQLPRYLKRVINLN